MTLITPPPTAPNRADPATFADRADAYVAWWATVAAEINGGALGATWVIGTVSEPSVRASTDENTGLNFLGSDQLQLVTGGVQRLLLNTSEALMSLPFRVSNVQAVSASNALDNLGDGNQVVSVGATNVATVNGPSGASRGLVRQEWLNSNYIAQVYSETDGTTPRQWVRIRDNGTWRTWRQIYNAATIVGTVSQSSSIPTGAVIERGFSANGAYTRFADGTQFCFHNVTTVSGEVTWTFPAVFSVSQSPPQVVVTPSSSLDQRSGTVTNISSTAVDIKGWTTVGAAWNGGFRAFAAGRWF